MNELVSPQASSATAPSVLSTIPTTIININPALPDERHISLAVNEENDSNESHYTALMMNDEGGVVIIDANSTTGDADRQSGIFMKKFLFLKFIFSICCTT